MTIFQTERLDINELKQKDYPFFVELLSAPEIIDPIPQPKWSLEEIQKQFEKFTNYPVHPLDHEIVVWGVFEKNKEEVIGLCALLTNDEKDRELAYRFRKKYWGIGYGTEVAKGTIDFCFNQLDLHLITADVNTENIGSVKILEKFLNPIREFYNERDQCTDRRYHLKKENWSK